jgi:iron complex transport system substrate-binding protein
MENHPMRIISLIASSTEIVHALDLGNQMVGRSHECDYPESVRALPVCTEPKFQLDGTSYEIDQRVKAILQDSLGVYRVFADRLEALQPDVIITQTQCDVCAVSLRDVEEAVCQLVSSRPTIIALEPNSLADVWRDIYKVAEGLNVPERGKSLVNDLQSRMQAIAGRTELLVNRPSVACIEWIEPLMAGGNWMPTLIEMAGGSNLFGKADQHSPWMAWEELVSADPDIIIISLCGWDIERGRQEMPALIGRSEWDQLKAVKNGRVYLTDGNQYFNRPGPRIVESLEILVECFHPDLFNFGHEGIGWVTF